ncbi:TPA_asm: P [Chrysanthemum alphacytorhabdovirus 1]|nr:TPA_asm: P [Chrysanthemum alphacytorhabdovirus 1]
MDGSNANEFAGAYTPDGTVDYVALANNDNNSVDELPVVTDKIPTQINQAADKPKTTPVGDVGATLGYLKKAAADHGAIVDGNMEALFKHYCSSEALDERDIDFFLKGYMFATGSQLAPKIHNATESLKVELRAVQKANAALAETIKLLANQAVSVEKEIAALSVNIKTDVTNALKSAIEGASKTYDPTNVSIVKKPITPTPPQLEKLKGPSSVPVTLSVGTPSQPSTSGVTNDAYFKKIRDIMNIIGVSEDVMKFLTDDELLVVYPEDLVTEYFDDLGDEAIRKILLEEIEKRIEDFLLKE